MSQNFFAGRKGLMLVISGPAGSGKGTIVNMLTENSDDFALSVSATTREPGANERDGVEYYFRSRDEFEKMIANGELLEHAEYVGNYYGTPKAPALEMIGAGKHLLLEIEVNGAMQIKKAYPEAILIMIVPPGVKEQERRLRTRGRDTEQSIVGRLKRAEEELKQVDKYDYIIVNETGKAEEAVAAVKAIVEANKNAVSRTPDIYSTYFGK